MNDESRRVGPCRYLYTQKPRVTRESVSFFRCEKCKTVLRGWPTDGCKANIVCCGEPMKRLMPKTLEELPTGRKLSYQILGGLNENCAKISWSGEQPLWLYLETFSGGQYMELGGKKRYSAVFAFAGEDAYAYCDKDPCQQCSFNCKNGFVLYACYEDGEVFEMPLNLIAATQGSPEHRTNKL